jgi:hypothetical protein
MESAVKYTVIIKVREIMRTKIPRQIEVEILFRNNHTCCICRTPLKQVQIHHINGDTADNSFSNLAVLCLDCHGRVTGDEGLGRHYSPEEVSLYKKDWENNIGRNTSEQRSSKGDKTLKLKLERPDYCKENKKNSRCELCANAFEQISNLVKQDQIPESGGWGKSQDIFFRYVIGREQTPLEKREGGIINTFMAIRGLLVYDQEQHFLQSPNGISAKNYLLTRQIKEGGFGRYISSRSGEEIHTSPRHTALAVYILGKMGGPPDSILKGLKYLSKIEPMSLKEDASFFVAAASFILAYERVAMGQWGNDHLTSEEKKELDLSNWIDKRTVLFRQIESESASSSNTYSPLWFPYGGFQKDVYFNALTTVDLLTMLGEKVPWVMIIKILNYFLRIQQDNGLPGDPSVNTPDIGITAYFTSICLRPNVYSMLSNSETGLRILNAASTFYRFVVEHISDKQFSQYTLWTTLANFLLIEDCPWNIKF